MVPLQCIVLVRLRVYGLLTVTRSTYTMKICVIQYYGHELVIVWDINGDELALYLIAWSDHDLRTSTLIRILLDIECTWICIWMSVWTCIYCVNVGVCVWVCIHVHAHLLANSYACTCPFRHSYTCKFMYLFTAMHVCKRSIHIYIKTQQMIYLNASNKHVRKNIKYRIMKVKFVFDCRWDLLWSLGTLTHFKILACPELFLEPTFWTWSMWPLYVCNRTALIVQRCKRWCIGWQGSMWRGEVRNTIENWVDVRRHLTYLLPLILLRWETHLGHQIKVAGSSRLLLGMEKGDKL